MLNAPAVHEVSLYGREADLAAIRALLDAAAAGHGGALVLTAGPGEGRTALLQAASRLTAPEWITLTAPAHADESTIEYSGLQRLLEPLSPLLFQPPLSQPPPAQIQPAQLRPSHLSQEQRELLAAVIAGCDPAVGPLVLGLAMLALLRLAARRGPVLCLLDDADQLDQSSGQLIRLLARRLDGLPVAVLASARGPSVPDGLPSRRLAPLGDEAGHDLLRHHAPGLTGDVAGALVDLAAGHPGALVDLARSLTPGQRRGFETLPTALPPDSRLRLHCRATLATLPAPTRRLLLLAAAAPEAHPADLLAAAQRDPSEREAGGREREVAGAAVTLADLEPAERAGLITVGSGGVRFTPPVWRSVVYDEEPVVRRYAAHTALAEVLAGRGRRLAALVHRAAVAAGPDDVLARDLLFAAEGAAPGEAFTAQRHAAELSSTSEGVARALLAAARSAMAAGRPHEARPMLRRAARLRGNASVRSRARGLIAELQLRGAPAESRDVLLDVAAELMPADPAGALHALLVVGEACDRTGESGRYPALARQAAARVRGIDKSPLDPDTEMALHQVVGLADLMTGADDAAFGHLREVLRLAEHTTDPAALIRAASTGILLGQDRRAARLAGRATALARAVGNAPLVPEALEVAAFAELAAGRYDAATEAALDGAAVARSAGRPDLAGAHLALLGLLAAFAGDRETSRERLAAGHATGEPLGDWAEALLDLVDGQPAAAAERLARIVAGGSMTLRVAVAPHLVEATGAGGEAFDRWAGRTGQPGWLALRSRCRALTDTEAADDYFPEALGWHARDEPAGFAAAHTELLYGRHLRRRRRPAEARDHLRRAAETFRRLDARPWAEQAARELRAAGERIGPVDRGPLTAQQERIAGLVAEGATNREVARQLHLSPRTIDHHLRNVFARLGVRSRTELARMLAG